MAGRCRAGAVAALALLASGPVRAADTTPALARPADLTLSIATHYTDAQRAPLTACLHEYERLHPGIRIVQQQAAIEDLLQAVLIARLGGASPDITGVYSQWAAQLVAGGVLDPPPPDILRLVGDAFLPSTVDAVRVDGRVWGIPGEISAFLLLYNKALFRRAGIAAPPRDWAELKADAALLTTRDAQGRIATAGYAFGPTAANAVYPFLALLASRGVALLTPGRDGTGLRTPQAIAVLAEQAQLFSRRLADPSVQVRDFPSGAVGMMIQANWVKDTLHEAFGSALEDTVGVAPIPGGADWRTLQYGFFWGVSAGSAHRRAAWDLLAWLNAPHGGGRSCSGTFLAGLGALTGNRADLARSPEYADAFSRPFVDAIAGGRALPAPAVLHGAELEQDLAAAIDRAWAGQAPAAALAQADAEITALLREPD